jgi:hypothetical protein
MLGLTPDDRILTNTETLSIPQIPKSLIVIGAGAVRVQFVRSRCFWTLQEKRLHHRKSCSRCHLGCVWSREARQIDGGKAASRDTVNSCQEGEVLNEL